jgi:hypothetical protein
MRVRVASWIASPGSRPGRNDVIAKTFVYAHKKTAGPKHLPVENLSY